MPGTAEYLEIFLAVGADLIERLYKIRKELQAEFRDALGAELEGETLVGDRPLAKPLVDTPLKKRSMEELAELVKQATNMWDWGDSGRQSWEAVEWDKYEARAGGTAL